MTSLPFKRLSK